MKVIIPSWVFGILSKSYYNDENGENIEALWIIVEYSL
jgi:hypothetical protein